MKLNPKTPILVGRSTLTQRLEDPSQAMDTVELMVEAAVAAGSDTGISKILTKLDEVIAMGSMTPMENPAHLVAEKIGAKGVRTLLAEVGTLQQEVFNRAMSDITSGKAEVVLVLGGEAQYRKLRSRITGSEVPDLHDVDLHDGESEVSSVAPDETLSPSSGIVHPLEVEMKLYSAPPHYAMLENAFGVSKGRSPTEQRQATAKLWESFSKVAAQNPLATFGEAKSADEIGIPGEKNRPISAPYNKWNCSQINVDQATALLFTSVGLAEDLNIPKEKWVFPYVGATSDNMVPVVSRGELHRSQGFNIVGQAALENISKTADEIEHLDLYSCFPVAVWLQTQELGIDINRQLTVTGGMTFAGGPLNSYVLGSLSRMVDTLRQDTSASGLVTSISGMVTKQGAGIWSCQPPSKSPEFLDLTKEVREATPVLEVDADYSGKAIVAGSTLLYGRDSTPERAICIADIYSGAPNESDISGSNSRVRTMAHSTDPKVLDVLASDECLGNIIGTQIHISKEREFEIV